MRSYVKKLGTKAQQIFNSEKGQGLVEYALILVLVAIVVFVGLKALGVQTSTTYSTIKANLTNP
jgi:pilus assembly protein Flp/PilA